MRDIKFRQKTKDSLKTWHYWGYVDGIFISPLISSEYQGVESQQFTGLKDKNGKEIYEGDIVRILYSGWGSKHLGTPKQQAMSLEEYLKSIGEIKIVQWDTNGFYVSHKIAGYSETMEVGQHGYIEVIGNIYENPELLK